MLHCSIAEIKEDRRKKLRAVAVRGHPVDEVLGPLRQCEFTLRACTYAPGLRPSMHSPGSMRIQLWISYREASVLVRRPCR